MLLSAIANLKNISSNFLKLRLVYVLRRHIVPAVLVSVMDSIPLDIGTAVLDFLAIADEYDEKESEEGGTSVRRRNSLSQTHQNEQRRRLITEVNLLLEILLMAFPSELLQRV